MTPATMIPVTGIPDPARMRGLGPITADSHIGAVTPGPLLVDPDVSRTRSNRSHDGMPNGTNRYIDLSGNGVGDGTHTDHQHCQKGQFYNFTLHMLVFKFTDWTLNSV
jgi:hypothetical protein